MSTDPRVPVALDEPAVRAALASELASQLGARAIQIHSARRLSGGAIQENWALHADVEGGEHAGPQRWVLRTDSPSSVSVSLGRRQEYAVLSRVVEAGVRAPRPLALVEHSPTLQRPYFLMQLLAGDAAGHRLTRDPACLPQPRLLLEDLAQSLANLHRLTPQAAALDFLSEPAKPAAEAAIEEYRAYLDSLAEPQPVLEWGLRWCELNLPEALPARMIHRDFRTGNYLVDQGRLSGILDWEFASFGDPREDLGWFSARCWRFAAPHREAGGIGELADFLAAYRDAGGLAVGARELVFWQVLAHLRWGVIALQQAQRHLSGQERSLELALTGRLLPDLEIEILALTSGSPT
ncbi:aminoglycoside phosphotransferase [Pseudomonas citronellolis]|uniref:Aminoglycoside phosphotransferase n=1 Tax=Pseudomonas citronellolis TaxID=53408 RepID=A0A1A9KIR0_9PSED|nr:phosphotransferase family protein [Pseudomonas citronellolis]ANI17487.1 aminoglycoside phosphotransferase [Pseudomonas citronellolis]